jgi:AbiV family abortive infection protein
MTNYDGIAKLQFKNGSIHAHLNSHRHFRCATILAGEKEYGVARSHLVLAREEAFKSLILFLRAHMGKLSSDSLTSLFRDHRSRLEGAQNLTALIALMKKIIMMAQKTENRVKLLKSFGHWAKRETRSKRSRIFIENEWWKNAGLLRSEGFYVDWSGEKWKTPAQITRTQYAKSEIIVSQFIELVDSMMSIDKKSIGLVTRQLTQMRGPNHGGVSLSKTNSSIGGNQNQS